MTLFARKKLERVVQLSHRGYDFAFRVDDDTPMSFWRVESEGCVYRSPMQVEGMEEPGFFAPLPTSRTASGLARATATQQAPSVKSRARDKWCFVFLVVQRLRQRSSNHTVMSYWRVGVWGDAFLTAQMRALKSPRRCWRVRAGREACPTLGALGVRPLFRIGVDGVARRTGVRHPSPRRQGRAFTSR
jgi:hypothetical protein